MKPELKAAWIEALRSGKYEQGRNTLRSDLECTTTYCCLGVLCEVARVPRYVDMKGQEGYGYFLFDAQFTSFPPLPLLQEWGMDAMVTDENTIAQHLAEMNDVDQKSFAKIADWIEENL